MLGVTTNAHLLDKCKPGIYRHYKNRLYQFVGLAHDANSSDLMPRDGGYGKVPVPFASTRIVVVYIGLELDDAHTGPRLAVRTLEDFFAEVCVSERCEHYGKKIEEGMPRRCVNDGHGWRRFSWVGYEYASWMREP